MVRTMKVTGSDLSEEEIENMLEQGRFVHMTLAIISVLISLFKNVPFCRAQEGFFNQGIIKETQIAKKQG